MLTVIHSHKNAVYPAVPQLWLLHQLPLRIFSAVKQDHCFLCSHCNAVWTPAQGYNTESAMLYMLYMHTCQACVKRRVRQSCTDHSHQAMRLQLDHKQIAFCKHTETTLRCVLGICRWPSCQHTKCHSAALPPSGGSTVSSLHFDCACFTQGPVMLPEFGTRLQL